MEKPLNKVELRASKPSKQDFSKIPRNPIYVILDDLIYPHNIGNILRLSEALLVTKIFICGNSPFPPNKKIRSGSRGAEKWIKWEYIKNTADVVKTLKNDGIFIASAEISHSSIEYSKAQYRFPMCLIFGNEDNGICEEALELSDSIVHLPIYGMANSINVASAASALLYEAVERLNG